MGTNGFFDSQEAHVGMDVGGRGFTVSTVGTASALD